jgi:carbohydrate-selective porin OprB
LEDASINIIVAKEEVRMAKRIFLLMTTALAAVYIFVAAYAYAGEGEAVLKILLKKGIITEAEYNDVMKEIGGANGAGTQKVEERVNKVEEKTADVENKQAEKDEHAHAGDRLAHLEEMSNKSLGNLTIGGFMTTVGQGAINNNGGGGREDVIDGTFKADFTVEAKTSENGKLFVDFEGGAGQGVQRTLTTLWGVNEAASDSSSHAFILEAWYEHLFFDKMLTFTIGKMDFTKYFDTNAVAGDETAQFLATGFKKNIAVEFPANGPGSRLTLSPNELVSISLGWQNGSSSWEDIAEGSFVIGELDIKPKIGELQGNYRFYGWTNGTDHARWDHPENTKEDGWGAGASIDQQLTKSLTVFGRAGYESPDVYMAKLAWSAGLGISGDLWQRDKDMLGLAYGMAHLSGGYEDTLRAQGISPEAERHVEVFYRISVNDHVAISPDIQYITNAMGDGSRDDAWVLGVRAHFMF